MARQVNVYGFADILVATSGTTYEDLGTTRDSPQITSNGFFLDIHNDENGGEAGPPVEIQYMGETANIRLELTKYDPAVAAKLEDHFANTGTPGVPAAPGTLMFTASQLSVGNGGAIGLKVACTTVIQGSGNTATPLVRTYKRCVIHDPIEVNRGTKFSTFTCNITAYKDKDGNLWTEGST